LKLLALLFKIAGAKRFYRGAIIRLATVNFLRIAKTTVNTTDTDERCYSSKEFNVCIQQHDRLYFHNTVLV
jgi:hypothetical protein